MDIDDKIYIPIAAFSDQGMKIYLDADIPSISKLEQETISNYYSIILGIGEKEGGLYGPLPVAYHIEKLLYLYTFEIVNPFIKDKRVKKGEKVPACALIFFPTYLDGLTAGIRKDLHKYLKSWSAKFTKITQIKHEDIEVLTEFITKRIETERDIQFRREKSNALVVAAKNIRLLDNVAVNMDKKVKVVLIGTMDILFTLCQQALLVHNYSKIRKYETISESYIDVELEKLDMKVLKLTKSVKDAQKIIEKDLDGILYFADFSSELSMNKHIEMLKYALNKTKKECVICYGISQTTEEIAISETAIPAVLKEAKERTISLLDLARPNVSIELSIIEFVERIIEGLRENKGE